MLSLQYGRYRITSKTPEKTHQTAVSIRAKLTDQLCWLAEIGFDDVDVLWEFKRRFRGPDYSRAHRQIVVNGRIADGKTGPKA